MPRECPASGILLLRPSVITESEWKAFCEEVAEANPGVELVAWSEAEYRASGWRGLRALRRRRFARCIIARGADPLGHSRTRLIAAIVGVPTEFEGKAWGRWDLLASLKGPVGVALYARLLRLVSLLARLRTRGRPPCPRVSAKVRECEARAHRFVYLGRCAEYADGPVKRVLQVCTDPHPAGADASTDDSLHLTIVQWKPESATSYPDGSAGGVPAGAYDAVLAMDIPRPLAGAAAFLGSLRRACRKGGVVLLRLAAGEGADQAAAGAQVSGAGDGRFEEALERVCSDVGLHLVRVEHLLDDSLTEVWLEAR